MTRDDLLDALWEITDLEGPRPEVELIREVSDKEWMTVHIECMTQAGFPPKSQGDQGVGWEVPADQVEAFDLANFTCEAQYPRRMELMQPYTPDQLNIMYQWMVDETIPCLAREGYEVSDVPTLESFRQGYSPQQGFWTPDSGVPGGVPIGVQEKCSHMPPPEILYGE